MLDFKKLNVKMNQRNAGANTRSVPVPIKEIVPEAFINKYRPKTWEALVGGAAVRKQVYAALDVNTHAYLFHGPAGTGKTTASRLLASKLEAETQEVNCATDGGVDDMRELVNSLTYRPLGASGRRVVVLDECHRLSKEAWTALLKPMEEPGDHTYFALCTTDPQKIPPTIRTRLASVELKPLTSAVLFGLLSTVADAEQLQIDDAGLRIIAESADGSPRQALALLATCHSATSEDEVRVACAVAGDAPDIIELARGLVSQTISWPWVVDILQAYEGQPESVRLLIVNYVAKVLLGTKSEKKALHLLAVLEAFQTPCNAAEKMAPILLAFGTLLLAV